MIPADILKIIVGLKKFFYKSVRDDIFESNFIYLRLKVAQQKRMLIIYLESIT